MQRVLSRVPAGHRLNYFLQRRVFGNLPTSDAKLAAKVADAREHVMRYERHGAHPATDSRFFEFGAGWDLVMPLAFYGLGVGRQTVVDLRPLARTELVDDVARRLSAPHLELPRVPAPVRGSLVDHLATCGIDYRAPSDAACTQLPDHSIDAITSTNTLEHIPPDEILSILIECRRILAPGGCMCFRIDYQDHYSYFDHRRSVYDFLAYDDRSWKRWSPSLHFQNRLRHHQYLELFATAGLDVLEVTTWGGDTTDLETLARVPLASPFSWMTPEQVAVRASWVVLGTGTTVAPSMVDP